jgi:hypothetical protein
MVSHKGWPLVITTSFFVRAAPETGCRILIKGYPRIFRTKTGMLDTSVTFYSGISTAIIGAWQRRHVYGQSQVARLHQKEQFSGAGSGTGLTFLSGSFIPMTERPK